MCHLRNSSLRSSLHFVPTPKEPLVSTSTLLVPELSHACWGQVKYAKQASMVADTRDTRVNWLPYGSIWCYKLGSAWDLRSLPGCLNNRDWIRSMHRGSSDSSKVMFMDPRSIPATLEGMRSIVGPVNGTQIKN